MQNGHQNTLERGWTPGLPLFPRAVPRQPSYRHRKGRGERGQALWSALLSHFISTPVQRSMGRTLLPGSAEMRFSLLFVFHSICGTEAISLSCSLLYRRECSPSWAWMQRLEEGGTNSSSPNACRGREACHRAPVPAVGSCCSQRFHKAGSRAWTLWGHAWLCCYKLICFGQI